MKQRLFSLCGKPSQVSTSQNPLFTVDSGTLPSTTISTPIPTSGTFRNFKVRLEAAPGASKSYTFTVYKNGSPTALTVTISGASDTSALDSSNSFTVAAGDTIKLHTSASGTPAASSQMRWEIEFDSDTAGYSIIGCGVAVSLSDSVRSYIFPFGGNLSYETTEGVGNRLYMPTSGTLRSLYAVLNTAPGSGNKYTFSIYKNGSEVVASKFDVSDTATTGSITGLSISVAKDDYISVSALPTSTPTVPGDLQLSIAFEADNIGETVCGAMNSGFNPGAGGGVAYFNPLLTYANTTEASIQSYTNYGGFVLKNLRLVITTAPGAGKSWAIQMRKNGSATGMNINGTIAESATSFADDTNSDTFAVDDLISLSMTASNSPAITGKCSASAVQVIPEAHTKNLDDSVTITETTARGATKPVTDSVSINDSSVVNRGLLKSLEDSMSVSELFAGDGLDMSRTIDAPSDIAISDSIVKSPVKVISDTLAIVELIVKTIGMPKSDTVSISDSISAGFSKIQELSDTVALAEALVKAIGKLPSDTISLADSLVQTVGKSLSDTIAITDSVSKLTGKSLAESFDITESLATLVQRGILPTDTFSLSDSIVKTTGKTLTELVTISDSIAKTSGMSMTDSFTLADSVSKTVGKPLSDSISIVEAAVLAMGLVKTDSVSLADSITQKTVGKYITENFSLAELIQKTTGKPLSDSFSIADSLVKTPGLIQTDTIALSDAIANKTMVKNLSELLTITESLAKTSGLGLSDSFSLAESISNRTGKTLSDSVSIAESLVKLIGVKPSDSVSISDSLNRSFIKTLTDLVDITDLISKTTGKPFSDSISITDSIVKTPGVSLTDSISIAESLIKTIGKGLTDSFIITEVNYKTVGKFLSETITIVDSLSKLSGRNISDIVSIADSLVKTTGKNLSETIDLIDSMVRVYGVGISDTVSITDALAKIIGKPLSDTLSMSDIIGFLKTHTLSDTVSLTDTLTKYAQLVKTDTVTVQDSKIVSFGKSFSETVSLADSLVKLSGLGVVDSFIISDVLVRSVGKSVTDVVSLSDSIQKTTGKSITDLVTIADSISKGAGIPLSDSIILADVLNSKGVGKNIADTLSILDAITTKGITKQILDTVTISDSKVSALGKALSDTVAIADVIALLRRLNLSDSLQLADSLAKTIGKPLSETVTILDSPLVSMVLSQSLSDSIAIIESVIKTPGRIITDTMTIAEALGFGQTKILVDTVSIADTIIRTFVDNYDKLYIVKEDIFSKKSSLYKPFTSGLVAYYRSDENTGSVLNDLSGNKLTANLSGSPAWATGKYGYTIDYDGSNDYALVNDNDKLDGFSELSVVLWAYLDVIPSGSGNPYQTLVTRYTWWGPYSVILETSGKIKFSASLQSGSTTRLDSATTFTAGSWYHLAMTSAQGGYLKIYVNGALDNSVAQVYPIGRVSNKMTIGGQDEGTSHRFNGKLDEILIYNRELSASEVLAIYQNLPQKVLEKFKGPRKKVMYQNRALHSRKNF